MNHQKTAELSANSHERCQQLEMSWEGLMQSVGLVNKQITPADERRSARALAVQRLRARKEHAKKLRAEAPTVVRAVEEELYRRGMQKCMFRIDYRAVLVLEPSDLRDGTVESLQYIQTAVNEGWVKRWRELQAKRPSMLAFPVSAEVVRCDASRMPIDVIVSLELTREKDTSPHIVAMKRSGGGDDDDDDDDDEYGNVDNDDFCVFERDMPVVCCANTHWSCDGKHTDASHHKSVITQQMPVPLLGDVCVISEPALGITISSVDAIGFDSTTLMTNVVRRATIAGHEQLYFAVPLDYTFAPLIKKCHALLRISELRQKHSALFVEAEPSSTFHLLSNDSEFLMLGADLDAAVHFINTRLVPAAQAFDVQRVFLRVVPFGGANWLEAWQAALNKTRATNALPFDRRARRSPTGAAAASLRADDKLELCIDLQIYMVGLPKHGMSRPNISSKPAAPVAPQDVHATAATAVKTQSLASAYSASAAGTFSSSAHPADRDGSVSDDGTYEDLYDDGSSAHEHAGESMSAVEKQISQVQLVPAAQSSSQAAATTTHSQETK